MTITDSPFNVIIDVDFNVYTKFTNCSIHHDHNIFKLTDRNLRLLSCVFNTNRVCHAWYNLKPGYTCRITVIFGTLEDGSLEINSLALNNCFSYRHVFQNGVNALSKMVYKNLKTVFCQKSQDFV